MAACRATASHGTFVENARIAAMRRAMLAEIYNWFTDSPS
jgi:hypothetical protein